MIVAGVPYHRARDIITGIGGGDARDNYYASAMLFGAIGLSPRGVMENDPVVVHAQLPLMALADRLILLADASQLRLRGNLLLCPFSELDLLITDDRAEPHVLHQFEAAGVEVVIAALDAPHAEGDPD